MANTLTKIVKRAKAIRKKHPKKYVYKKYAWRDGYMVEAARYVKKKGKVGAVKKSKRPRKKTLARKKPGKSLVRAGEVRTTSTRTSYRVGTKKKYSSSSRKVGSVRRPAPRRVGATGAATKGLMIIGGLALAGVVLFGLLKKKQPTQQTTLPAGSPPIAQTNNPVRNQQSGQIVQYAIAAGLAADAIIKIIKSLNEKSDKEVNDIYDKIDATGDIPGSVWV